MRHHLFHYSAEWSDATVRRWIRRVGKDRVQDLYAINEADVRGKGKDCSLDLAALAGLKAHVEKVLLAGDALSTRDLRVNGRDLMQELGVKPGRLVGELLEALLEAVVSDPAENDRELLLAKARGLLKARADEGK